MSTSPTRAVRIDGFLLNAKTSGSGRSVDGGLMFAISKKPISVDRHLEACNERTSDEVV
jgi:hypothetical protein